MNLLFTVCLHVTQNKRKSKLCVELKTDFTGLLFFFKKGTRQIKTLYSLTIKAFVNIYISPPITVSRQDPEAMLR